MNNNESSDNPPRNETFLGDGLFASYDGFQIQLRAPRFGSDHIVFLNPEVLRTFIAYVEAIGYDRK